MILERSSFIKNVPLVIAIFGYVSFLRKEFILKCLSENSNIEEVRQTKDESLNIVHDVVAHAYWCHENYELNFLYCWNTIHAQWFNLSIYWGDTRWTHKHYTLSGCHRYPVRTRQTRFRITCCGSWKSCDKNCGSILTKIFYVKLLGIVCRKNEVLWGLKYWLAKC